MSDPRNPTQSAGVCVCIPTADRPEPVRRLLESVRAQKLRPSKVVVVDASKDDATRVVCAGLSRSFGDDVLDYVHAGRGLTKQRRRGIDKARAAGARYVCMLDDDVVLDPAFLANAVAFLESERGRDYGGVAGYDLEGWGRPFDRLERFYLRLGLYDGELRPGRWLFCGKFLELSRLEPFVGVFDADFIGGGLTVWRAEVFDDFLPPSVLDGYALCEDKHLSLRVGARYRLGVLGEARLRHERADGGRHSRIAMGFMQIRREALLLRDCDPMPRWRRYSAFLAVTAVDLSVRMLISMARARFRELPRLLGAAAAWVSCVLRPPSRSADALDPGVASAPRSRPRTEADARAAGS